MCNGSKGKGKIKADLAFWSDGQKNSQQSREGTAGKGGELNVSIKARPSHPKNEKLSRRAVLRRGGERKKR